jgi:hypothetical protein
MRNAVIRNAIMRNAIMRNGAHRIHSPRHAVGTLAALEE